MKRVREVERLVYVVSSTYARIVVLCYRLVHICTFFVLVDGGSTAVVQYQQLSYYVHIICTQSTYIHKFAQNVICNTPQLCRLDTRMI